ncbi:hypothetical protein BJY04DRAFT_213521 [Aspergillus karnatakaensis]|uniref:uncharacterized protein n=1 Tax=Aspergillus karnatakaensis TaxID=1810916 RepID=UPI003CCC8FCE
MDGVATIEKNADVEGGGTARMTIVVRAVVLLLAISTTLVCGLRLYLRKFILQRFGLDDWLVILALIGVNGFSALAYTCSYYGLGADTEDVSADDLATWFKIYFGAECTYLAVGAAVKISLTVFIMRLFPTQFVRISGIAIMIFIGAFTISMTLALTLKCKPVRASWDKSILDARCWDSGTNFAVLMTQGVIMFVLDVVILALPIRPIWKLQMPVKKRLMILGLFALGFIACIAALVRFSTLAYAKDETNFTSSAATSLIWMEVEFNLALMSGSLSSLPKFFTRHRTTSHSLSLSITSSTPSSERKASKKMNASGTPLEQLSSGQTWGRGIRKKTEITRVFEEGLDTNTSQERIAPIYGAGELMTTTSAYSEMENENEVEREVERELQVKREKDRGRNRDRDGERGRGRERDRKGYEEFGEDSS